MHLTPRELDKLLIYMMAEVALKRKQQGLKLNHPEAVAVISATALDGARAGKTLEEVMTLSGKALTRADVMDGVADMIPRVQLEAVFDDGSRLVTVHSPIQLPVLVRTRRADEHSSGRLRPRLGPGRD
jgi:urease subunit gamma